MVYQPLRTVTVYYSEPEAVYVVEFLDPVVFAGPMPPVPEPAVRSWGRGSSAGERWIMFTHNVCVLATREGFSFQAMGFAAERLFDVPVQARELQEIRDHLFELFGRALPKLEGWRSHPKTGARLVRQLEVICPLLEGQVAVIVDAMMSCGPLSEAVTS